VRASRLRLDNVCALEGRIGEETLARVLP